MRIDEKAGEWTTTWLARLVYVRYPTFVHLIQSHGAPLLGRTPTLDIHNEMKHISTSSPRNQPPRPSMVVATWLTRLTVIENDSPGGAPVSKDPLHWLPYAYHPLLENARSYSPPCASGLLHTRTSRRSAGRRC